MKQVDSMWAIFGSDGVPYMFPTRQSARKGGKLVGAKGEPIKFVRA